MILRVGGAKTIKTVLGNRMLPGEVFFDRETVAFARLFEADEAALYAGDNFSFAAGYPSRCVALRQIR
jgi:hypothetical protein